MPMAMIVIQVASRGGRGERGHKVVSVQDKDLVSRLSQR